MKKLYKKIQNGIVFVSNKLLHNNSINSLVIKKHLSDTLELQECLDKNLILNRSNHNRVQFAATLVSSSKKRIPQNLYFHKIPYCNNTIPLEERKLYVNQYQTDIYGRGIDDPLYALEIKAFMYKLNSYLSYTSTTHATQLLKLQVYILLSDTQKINKYLNKIIQNFMIRLAELDIIEKDISYFKHQMRISISIFSLINNLSKYLMEKKGELIEVDSFYKYFDLLFKYKKECYTSLSKDDLQEIERNMAKIFSNYTNYCSTYKNPKEHNNYLKDVYQSFGDYKVYVLTTLSLPAYYTKNCSFQSFAEVEYNNLKNEIEQKFDLEHFYALIKITNILGKDNTFLCNLYIKNTHAIINSSNKTMLNDIHRLLLENPNYDDIFIKKIKEIFINVKETRVNRLQNGFMLVSAYTKYGLHQEAKQYILDMLDNFSCKSSLEAVQYINAMDLLCILFENKDIFEDLYYEYIFRPLYRGNLTTTGIILFLNMQSKISKLYNLEILDIVYQTKLKRTFSKSDQLVIINPYSDMNNYFSPIHIYNNIVNRDIPIINLCESEVPFFNENTDIHKLSSDNDSVLGIKKHWSELYCNWKVSFEDQQIICNGINMYQTFFETLARSQKMFSFDFNAAITNYYFKLFQRRVDRNAYVYENVFKMFPDTSFKFITSMYHYTPISYYSTRFRAKNNPKKESLIQINSAYENRAVDVENSVFDSIAALNLTLNSKSRAVLFGSSENFSEWAKNKIGDYTLNDKFQHDHTQTLNIELKEKILKAKSDGKIVACVLGKLLYDLCVPYMGGTFKNMKEWAFETNNFVLENDNIFLLVKAHPHEVNYSVSNVAKESFLDWFDNSSNIYKLGHREAGLELLIPIVDIFLLWNGTSVINIAKERKNVIVCDDWANNDYPIGLYQPKTHKEYFTAIENAKEWDSNSKNAYKRAKLAELYNEYLELREFTARNIGVIRSSTNVNWNRPYFHLKNLINEINKPTQDWNKIVDKVFEV